MASLIECDDVWKTAGNPVQDIYLREVKGNYNEFRSVAVKALADPARGCKL